MHVAMHFAAAAPRLLFVEMQLSAFSRQLSAFSRRNSGFRQDKC
jgi:hypothetical protein